MSRDEPLLNNVYEDNANNRPFLGNKFAQGQIESDDSMANATIASASVNLAQ